MTPGLAAFTRAVTKRARRGLYAGKKVLSGNNVSEDGGNRWGQVASVRPKCYFWEQSF